MNTDTFNTSQHLTGWVKAEYKSPRTNKIMEIHNPFESIYNQLEIINRKLDEIQSLGNNTRPANSEDETLTVNEVCRILKIKPATIYGRTCKNAIPFTKKGKRLVFFRSDIVKYQREGYRPTNDEIEKSNVEELVKNRKRKTHC